MYNRICVSKSIGVTLLLGILFSVLLLGEPAAAANRWNLNSDNLANFETKEIITIQRLLKRLGHLNDSDMTRKPDDRTLTAILAHLQKVNFSSAVTGQQVIRSLFRTAWNKEGWGLGKVEGQDLVVDPEEVRAAQSALEQLDITPGPIDGIFGPATFSAVEVFQEDNGLNVTGLLTRNIEQSIHRRVALRTETPKSIVRILNWPDYIDPDVLIQFEKETKIKIVHEVFESSDETAALLMMGSSKYDVMVQTDTKMRQLVDDGQALMKLDRNKLPNSRHLDDLALTYTSVLDPENKHSLPYMWGTIGIAVNETKVNRIISIPALNDMSLFMKPELAAALSKCGLAFVDEAADVIPLMIAYLGGDLLDIKTADLQKVDQSLSKVAKYINLVSADRIIDDLSEGKYCVAVGYSGDVFAARDAAQESGTGKISYHVPATGSVLWFDRLVIPAQARNVEGAYQFINFLLRPKIAAANTNYLQYASPNLAAKPHVEPELRNDPGVYPPADVMKKLVVLYPPDSDEQIKVYNQIWSRLRGN